MSKYKYILWVGGIDDHYDTHKEAHADYLEWKRLGYDDVEIQQIPIERYTKRELYKDCEHNIIWGLDNE